MFRRIAFPTTALLLGGALLAGCATTATTATTSDDTSTTSSATASVLTGEYSAEAVLAANENASALREDEWDASAAVAITLQGTTATSAAADVTVDGSTVTITAAGTYELSGTLEGSVMVDAPEDAVVVLILNGVDISTDEGAAIVVLSADDVAISLAADSVNTVSDASTYAEDADINAAIFSEADLTITGEGALIVRGNGGDGITSEDDLVIESGDITVIAADDALRGKDSVTVEGGTLDLTADDKGIISDNEDEATRGYISVTGGDITITAGDDGLNANTDLVITGGSLDISSGDDGLHAEAVLVIEGGDVSVTDAVEGIEGYVINLAGGTIDVTASDDGVNAAGGDSTVSEMADGGQLLLISGGTITIDADGDGLDSNGTIEVSGGDIRVDGPTANGNGALDSNGSFTITGGTLLAIGSSGMAVSPDASSAQSFVAASFSTASAGSTVQLVDASGSVVAEFTLEKDASSVVYSSAELTAGESYSVLVNGSSVATATAGEASAGGMGGPGGGGGAPAGPGQRG